MPWRVVVKTKGGGRRGKPYTASTHRTKTAAKKAMDKSRKHYKNMKQRLKDQGIKFTYSVTMYEVKK